MTTSAAPRRKRTVMEVLASLRQPKVTVMLALGFASGLPFLLTANTFGYWLRDEGTSLKAIGFISWVGLAYTFKYLWAPVVDRVDVPLLGRLGRRRGWMLFTQILVIAGLIGMAGVGTGAGLTAIGAFALLVAFASSTQDINIDAWRIEAAADSDEQGLLTSGYQLGYRVALLVTDALVIAAAARVGWPMSYVAMAALMTIGVVATFFAMEPARAEAALQDKAPLWTPRGFFDAVIGPFAEFFGKHRWLGLVMLLAVALYRLPDFVMGPMYNPYYHDLGLTKDTVALVRGSVGLFATFAGIALGGIASIRLGVFRALMIGVVLEGFGTAAFALLAYHVDGATFAAVMGLDSFAQAFAGVALVAYMSSLTSLGYTATQYALLSSTYALLGKFLKGFSGAAVEALTPTHGLLGAYATAFVGTGLMAVPPALLFLLLGWLHDRREKAAAAKG
ncbi:AmpG family muropeptide MFS transporter [Phenylobacterium soli]|uniref:MFS transporter n=1 Tax=Phenylobacterium soli TaxID=2170551 RepID=A0A328AFM8_9CAUL|nr:MFS transporter [Phenylobacterium soli]RAK53552.1 MFS transporter [Phenylobacterium soli]